MRIHQLSASELSSKLEAGELSSVEITEALIARRQEVDPRINAFTQVNEAAVEQARAADEATESVIAERLTAALGKEAIPHFRVKPEIIGGLVVRTKDTIFDGSIRRRLDGMRRKLLHAPLPDEAGG